MSAQGQDKTRILVVDDSVLMRKAASKMLGDEFEVVVAKDGVEGWDSLIGDTTIQVVFTDLSMPRMDGYELLQKIRASDDEGTVKMPVIIVTGAENDEAARRKALDLGATDFITKPFGSIDLLARARAHANYRRITQRLEQQITLDVLTGLVNRAGFLDRLQQDLAYARRHGAPLSLVRIEIDGFREVFLRRGKETAELLVKQVADLLRQRVRKEDTAARIGLASFALALPAGQHEGSRALIERLGSDVASCPMPAEGGEIHLTLSAAVCSPETQFELEAKAVLEEAEVLLRQAIAEGGNRVLGQVHPSSQEPPEASPVVDPGAASGKPVVTGIATAQPPTSTPSPAQDSDTPAVPAAPVPPAVSEAAPAALPISIDAALALIESGRVRDAASQLPQLVRRLLPLFRLLSDRQRDQLIAFLQKLGV